jgi:hypothetical protein
MHYIGMQTVGNLGLSERPLSVFNQKQFRWNCTPARKRENGGANNRASKEGT